MCANISIRGYFLQGFFPLAGNGVNGRKRADEQGND
jgi:hypothetical protein